MNKLFVIIKTSNFCIILLVAVDFDKWHFFVFLIVDDQIRTPHIVLAMNLFDHFSHLSSIYVLANELIIMDHPIFWFATRGQCIKGK